MSLKNGEKAPLFTLKNQDENDVSLESFHGKNILILFFPFAFSSVCTKEFCLINNSFPEFDTNNTTVLGISVDSHYSLRAWKKENNIKFDLLSDFNKEVSKKFDVLEENFFPEKLNYKGVSKRAVFILNKEGDLVYSEICKAAYLEPDYDKINEVLSSLN